MPTHERYWTAAEPREGAEELLRHHQHPFVQGKPREMGEGISPLCGRTGVFHSTKHYETARTPGGDLPHILPSPSTRTQTVRLEVRPSPHVSSRGPRRCQGKLTPKNPAWVCTLPPPGHPQLSQPQRTLGLPRGSSGATRYLWTRGSRPAS